MIRLFALLMLLPTVGKTQPLCPCLLCILPTHDSFWVTAGAMKPTFEPNECIVANLTDDPQPGDAVVFRHFIDDVPYVFISRLMAIQGQSIAIVDDQVFIDETPIPRTQRDDYIQVMRVEGIGSRLPRCPPTALVSDTCAIPHYTETYGTQSWDVLDLEPNQGEFFGPVIVPPGHVFMLSDNRLDASDSRLSDLPRHVGFVPAENIVGVIQGPAND